MPIRYASVDDIPGLVRLGKRMHAITRFKKFDYSEQRVAAALRAALTEGAGRYVCFVAESADREVVGGLLAVLERHIFTDQLTASVMHFDVLPERRMGGYGLRLLKAFEVWAANRRVSEVCFGINSGAASESVGNFAKRCGYVHVGGNYLKELQPTRSHSHAERGDDV